VPPALVLACLASGALLAGPSLREGAPVEAEDGARSIEDLAVGDRVWSLDPSTGQAGYHEILQTFVHRAPVIELELVDHDGARESLVVTAEHPFWRRDREREWSQGHWTGAAALLPGDEVFTSRGGWARIGGGTWIAGEQLVYNFEVEGAHTYFVGETGAWVHNDCFTRDQRALNALARDAARTGVTRSEGASMLRWGRELDIPVLGHTRTTHWPRPTYTGTRPPGAPASGPLPHIHVGNKHIWVR